MNKEHCKRLGRSYRCCTSRCAPAGQRATGLGGLFSVLLTRFGIAPQCQPQYRQVAILILRYLIPVIPPFFLAIVYLIWNAVFSTHCFWGDDERPKSISHYNTIIGIVVYHSLLDYIVWVASLAKQETYHKGSVNGGATSTPSPLGQ